ncbi:MAG: hypothetical protein Q8J88_05390, partial [Bacteroidales bacterium]|nr:hypothetical protein [Bacteroidales bacterium]
FIQIVDVLRIACLPVTKLVRKIFYPKYFSLIIYKGLAIVLFLCGIAEKFPLQDQGIFLKQDENKIQDIFFELQSFYNLHHFFVFILFIWCKFKSSKYYSPNVLL